MTPTREERIDYCLAIARKLWPDVADDLVVYAEDDCATLRMSGAAVLIDINQHPRALEALESALLTLSGHDHGAVDPLAALGAALGVPPWLLRPPKSEGNDGEL